MDKFQVWLYVIIAVVYFLSRLRKKQAGQPDQFPEGDQERQGERPGSREQSATPKTLTFEDLLREITQSKAQPKEESVVDYDDDLQDEAESLEEVDFDFRKDNKTYEAYEEAKKQAFFRPSLEDSMKLEDTVMSFGKFKEFERGSQRNLSAEYLRDLRGPESLKQAIVLSEILKTKF